VQVSESYIIIGLESNSTTTTTTGFQILILEHEINKFYIFLWWTFSLAKLLNFSMIKKTKIWDFNANVVSKKKLYLYLLIIIINEKYTTTNSGNTWFESFFLKVFF